jgi:L-amino acid N-acyltransferase YncA
MTPEHGQQVLAIYQAGIDGGNATFETEAPVWDRFDAARLRRAESPTDPPTPESSSTPSTWIPQRTGAASEGSCLMG